jgi:hypothetical protein
MCNMHYRRWRKHGTTDLIPQFASPAKRLAAGLVRAPNGCLEWTRSTRGSGGGYGQIWFDGKQVRTHRLAWELAHGPIPDGMKVCHHCDNPSCCQTDPTEGYPDGHLFLGDHDDNMADKVTKGRQRNQNVGKTHCPANHEYTEANTHINKRGSRVCRDCKKTKETTG